MAQPLYVFKSAEKEGPLYLKHRTACKNREFQIHTVEGGNGKSMCESHQTCLARPVLSGGQLRWKLQVLDW